MRVNAKIISKTKDIDPLTMCPKLILKVEINTSIESMLDIRTAHGEDKLHEIIGKAIFDELKKFPN